VSPLTIQEDVEMRDDSSYSDGYEDTFHYEDEDETPTVVPAAPKIYAR